MPPYYALKDQRNSKEASAQEGGDGILFPPPPSPLAQLSSSNDPDVTLERVLTLLQRPSNLMGIHGNYLAIHYNDLYGVPLVVPDGQLLKTWLSRYPQKIIITSTSAQDWYQIRKHSPFSSSALLDMVVELLHELPDPVPIAQVFELFQHRFNMQLLVPATFESIDAWLSADERIKVTHSSEGGALTSFAGPRSRGGPAAIAALAPRTLLNELLELLGDEPVLEIDIPGAYEAKFGRPLVLPDGIRRLSDLLRNDSRIKTSYTNDLLHLASYTLQDRSVMEMVLDMLKDFDEPVPANMIKKLFKDKHGVNLRRPMGVKLHQFLSSDDRISVTFSFDSRSYFYAPRDRSDAVNVPRPLHKVRPVAAESFVFKKKESRHLPPPPPRSLSDAIASPAAAQALFVDPSARDRPLFVYCDNTNSHLLSPTKAATKDFDLNLVYQGRHVEKKCFVGSFFQAKRSVEELHADLIAARAMLEEDGWEHHLQPYLNALEFSSRGEKHVDDMLHGLMIRDICADCMARQEQTAFGGNGVMRACPVLVLMSGDSNSNPDGPCCFPKVIEFALTNGWYIEIWLTGTMGACSAYHARMAAHYCERYKIFVMGSDQRILSPSIMPPSSAQYGGGGGAGGGTGREGEEDYEGKDDEGSGGGDKVTCPA